MTPDVLVSVVLPSYNAVSYLSDAAESILAQTVTDLELIIVDDCSSDGSYDIAVDLSKADPRVRCLRLEQNAGYPSAMNVGIDAARGRFLARMDADDLSLPTRLEAQLAAFRPDEHSLCGTRRLQVTPRGYPIPSTQADTGVTSETWDDLVADRRTFTDSSVLTTIEQVRSVGGYRTYTRAGQDVDLWLRLMERYGPAVVLRDQLYARRLLPGAITYTAGLRLQKQVVRDLAFDRRETGADILQRGGAVDLPAAAAIPPESLEWVASADWSAAERCATAGDAAGAWRFLRKALASEAATERSVRHRASRSARVIAHGARGLLGRRGRPPQRLAAPRPGRRGLVGRASARP